MGNGKFLYGAAVQGIQNFIFQTNELKDIVGASELVNKICREAFNSFTEKKDGVFILRAAGNIKYEFSSEEYCRRAVLEFPRAVMKMAPGVTISQAVIKEEGNFKHDVEKLETLLRVQRNKPMRSMAIGLTGIERSRKTGSPAVELNSENEYIDAATREKRKSNDFWRLCELSFGVKDLPRNRLALNIEDITSKNDWIAVIHADGNGLGEVVQKVGKDAQELSLFSEGLNKSTETAANTAYRAVAEKYSFVTDGIIPIRPILLGGDDLTVICRADMAIDYTQTFLREFEKETANRKGGKLTACAGIAFIKSSYPFYYGYNLAEALCNRAKKAAKEIKYSPAPSCLIFHKVQDSFVDSYMDIVKRELTPCKNHSFEFGPYYLCEQAKGQWTIDYLLKKMILLNSKEGNAIKSHLRQWMSLMIKSPDIADQKKIRVISMLSPTSQKELIDFVKEVTQGKLSDGKFVYPVYDLLSLNSVVYQVTK